MDASVLLAMDGNESLKRRHRTRVETSEEGEDVNVSIEAPDGRKRHASFFIDANKVDTFRGEVKSRVRATKFSVSDVRLSGKELTAA